MIIFPVYGMSISNGFVTACDFTSHSVNLYILLCSLSSIVFSIINAELNV